MSNLKKTKRFNHYATLECGNGFYVDIITHNETVLGTVVEAFLFHDQYGIKDLMFGCKLDDCRTYGNFIEMVSNNIDEYIESYKEDHMDE